MTSNRRFRPALRQAIELLERRRMLSFTLDGYDATALNSRRALVDAVGGGAASPAASTTSLARPAEATSLTGSSPASTLIWDVGGGGTPFVEGAGAWANGSTNFSDL